MPKLSEQDIFAELKPFASEKNREGMARFGIDSKTALGVPVPKLRALAKRIGRDHGLAGRLWAKDVHELKLLACFMDEPVKVTNSQMDKWTGQFYSWDVCDQCCSNLWDKTSFAWKKPFEWSKDEREFVRRAGFVMMACLAVHDKKADDRQFLKFFPLIKKYSVDERNFVRKAVNWALRQIGKRSPYLRKEAIKVAEQIGSIDSKSARWIAADALRELL
ncbi:MAG: DNA alkylation repair protein [Candidatus Aenigmatarchaeota archaeon]